MKYQSPLGALITGIRESITVTAHINGIHEEGYPEYAGSTDVHWDTQEPIKENGNLIYVDENSDVWSFDQLIKVEE